MAENWGYRSGGSNPCRHIPLYIGGKPRLSITDEEWPNCSGTLNRLSEGLVPYIIAAGDPSAIERQFSNRLSILMKADIPTASPGAGERDGLLHPPSATLDAAMQVNRTRLASRSTSKANGDDI